MNKEVKEVGQAAFEAVKRAVKISHAATRVAVWTAKEFDSAESGSSASIVGGTSTNGVPELKIFNPNRAPSMQRTSSKDSSSNNHGKESAEQTAEKSQATKKVAVIVADYLNEDCRLAYMVDPESSLMHEIWKTDEFVNDSNPEHPLFRERHKREYRKWLFQQKHPKLAQLTQRLKYIVDDLLFSLCFAALLAVFLLSVLVLITMKTNFQTVDGYLASDLTGHLGINADDYVEGEDVTRNANLYSDFSTFMQLTPTNKLGKELAGKTISGEQVVNASCRLKTDAGFIMDFWVCLPKGRSNDSLAVIYPRQLTAEEPRPMQFFLINDKQYQKALLDYFSAYTASDESWQQDFNQLNNASAEEIISAVRENTLNGEYNDGDKTRDTVWRVALDTRTIATQVNLAVNSGVADLRRCYDTEKIIEITDVQACLDMQQAGEIPSELQIPESTAKIIHYQTEFTTPEADYVLTIEDDGLLGSSKIGMFVNLIAILFVIISAYLFISNGAKYFKPLSVDSATQDEGDSAEHRDVAK